MLEWPSSKRQEITNIGKDVKKREPLCTVGAILIVMENSMEYLIKLRTMYGVSHKIKNYQTIQLFWNIFWEYI